MSGPSLDQFVQTLRKSGLVEESTIDKAVAQVRAKSGAPVTGVALGRYFERLGLLTPFQLEKLLAGRTHGFHLGQFTILEQIGEGGMGMVFLARHRKMNRQVALKVLPTSKSKDSSALARFYREAKAIAALNHPNIVHAHDISQEGKTHFLVMEFVEGVSLQELVKRHGPLSIERAANYLQQSARGLQHLFENNMIHRDIKPGNLLVDRQGVVKLLDLGLARFFVDDDNITREHDEAILGTADYMAPEQAIDSHDVDIRADVYSLGCTLYFLLAGKPPFQEATLAQKLIFHQMKPPPPLRDLRPEVPEELAAVVAKMLAKSADERYATPADVVTALEPWCQTPIPPPSEEEIPRKAAKATIERPVRDEARTETATKATGNGVARSSGAGTEATQALRSGDSSRLGEVDATLDTVRPRSKRLPVALALAAFLSVVAAYTTFSKFGSRDPNPADSASSDHRPSDRRDDGTKDADSAKDRGAADATAKDKDPPPPVVTGLDLYRDPLPPFATARLGTVRFSRRPGANQAEVSPDGKVLAVGPLNFAWFDAVTGEPFEFDESFGQLSAFVLAPDGSSVFVAIREGGGIHHYRRKPPSSEKIRSISRNDTVTRLVLSHDSRRLAAVIQDRRVFVIDVAAKSIVQTVHNATPFLDLAFTADDKSLVFMAGDGKLIRREIASGTEASVPIAVGEMPSAARLALDARTIFVRTPNRIKVFDCDKGILLAELDKTTNLFAPSPDGKFLAWRDKDDVVLTEVSSKAERLRLLAPDVVGMSFFPDGQRFAVVRSCSANIVDVKSRRFSDSPERHVSMVDAVGWQGQRIVSASRERLVRFWSPTGKSLGSLPLPRSFTRIDMSDDGRTLAGKTASEIELWNVEQRTMQGTVKSTSDVFGVSSDGSRLAVVDGSACNLFDLRGQSAGSLTLTPNVATKYVAVSKAGAVVSVSTDKGIQVHRVSDRSVLQSIPTEHEQTAISSDGAILAASLPKRNLSAWNVEKKARLLTADAKQLANLGGMTFSKDGKMLAAWFQDRVVRLYDLESGKRIAELKGYAGHVRCAAFSDDGRHLVTGCNDGTLLVWDVQKAAGR